ncbi:hypothetical protein ACFOW6_17660 [Fodinicurvata halophila]|uniref:Anti-sigma factor RsiW n=1 Tax=Fodinicurvata halophila TaxID=1419723 RepID=A0ABV8UQU8_9PROT
MPDHIYSWEQLNAYVDGELPPAQAADIAAAAADEPQVAQTIATLARLKATTRSELESRVENAPPIHTKQAQHAGQVSGRKWPRALAASLGVAAVLGGAAWYGLQLSEAPRSWIAAAEHQHEEWLTSAIEIGQEEGPVLREATGGADNLMEISVDDVTGYAPDLSLAGMRITRFSDLRSARGEQFFVGYLGENGCQLSLTIAAAPEELERALSMEWHEDSRAIASWRVGDTAYAAVAHKMDRQRFKQLIAYIEQVTRQAGEEEESTQMARDMENEGRPCLA